MKNLVKNTIKTFFAITMAFILAFGMISWTNVKTAFADDGNQVYDEDGFITTQALETRAAKNVNVNITVCNLESVGQNGLATDLDGANANWSGLLSSVLQDLGLWNVKGGSTIKWFVYDIFGQFLSGGEGSTGPSPEQLLLEDIRNRQNILSNQICGLKNLLTETQCSEILRDFNSDQSHGSLYLKDLIDGLNQINEKYKGKFDDKKYQDIIKQERLDALTNGIGIHENAIDSAKEDIDIVTNKLAGHIVGPYEIPDYSATSLIGVKTIQQRLQTYWYNQAYDNMENFVNGILQTYTCLAMLDLLSISARIEKCKLYNEANPDNEKHTTMLEVRYKNVLEEMKLISKEFDKYKVVREDAVRCFWHGHSELYFSNVLKEANVREESSPGFIYVPQPPAKKQSDIKEWLTTTREAKLGDCSNNPYCTAFDLSAKNFHKREDGGNSCTEYLTDDEYSISKKDLNEMIKSCNADASGAQVSVGDIINKGNFKSYSGYNKDCILLTKHEEGEEKVYVDKHGNGNINYEDYYPVAVWGAKQDQKTELGKYCGEPVHTFMFQHVDEWRYRQRDSVYWKAYDKKDNNGKKFFNLVPIKFNKVSLRYFDISSNTEISTKDLHTISFLAYGKNLSVRYNRGSIILYAHYMYPKINTDHPYEFVCSYQTPKGYRLLDNIDCFYTDANNKKQQVSLYYENVDKDFEPKSGTDIVYTVYVTKQ